MALDGEAIKQVFKVIRSPGSLFPPTPPFLPDAPLGCCGDCVHKIFADTNGASGDLSNDFAGPHAFFPAFISAATLHLQKWDDATGQYLDAQLINDLTIASRFEYFGNSTNVDLLGNQFFGARVEWHLVFALFGEGSYRFNFTFSSFLGSGQYVYNKAEYCLHQYSPEDVDNTVRYEYYLDKEMGVNIDDSEMRDYQNLDWADMLRLPGSFSYGSSAYVKDYTTYNDRTRSWVKDEQEPEFEIIIKELCWDFHQIMRTDVLQADRILVTDYNSRAFDRGTWVRKSVQSTSGYKPNFFKNQSLLASETQLKFRQAQNNLIKRR